MKADLFGVGGWAEAPVAMADSSGATCDALSPALLGPSELEAFGRFSLPRLSTSNMHSRRSQTVRDYHRLQIRVMGLHGHVLAEAARRKVDMLGRFLKEIPPPRTRPSASRWRKRGRKPKYLLGRGV